MAKRLLILFFVPILMVFWGSGLDKNDFEEVNFAFDSAILVDGFPSMLRLADILAYYPDFIVKVEGHCDGIGSNQYNDKLAMERVDAVKNFLTKYGARPEQIEVAAQGKKDPKADNATREGRFQNRRVIFTLYKMVDGRKVEIKADAPISDILRELAKYPIQDKLDAMANKQDAILEKLAKLDDLDKIFGKLNEMEEEIATLQARLKDVEEAPVEIAEVETTIEEPTGWDPEVKGLSLLGFDMGVDNDGDFTMNVSGRYFHRFTPTFALQTQAEYLHYLDRDEFQFDMGLVKRYGLFQMGAFTSFKRIKMDMFDQGGTLAQGAVTAELIFDNVSIGGFATHALIRESVVDTDVISINRRRETFLNTLDQYGAMFQFGLPNDFLVEGNVALINRRIGNDSIKPGGVVRLVGPINDNWSWFIEGGWNETLITDDNTGRFAGGIRFGNWKSPTTAADGQAVPVDVPRLRYDVRTRIVRTGNSAPIADAGPDQIDVPEGLIQLDGSGSFDPDDDPITYSWTQIQGPPVVINGPDTVNPTFIGEEGTNYAFDLTVTDSFGDIGQDNVQIRVKKRPPVEVLYFIAEPAVISLGQQSQLSWKVLWADTVEIEGIGVVENPTEGSLHVVPSVTTTYTLIATGKNQVRTTVVVEVSSVDIKYFHAEPPVIARGETAELHWQVDNAETVTISGIGTVDASGSVTVAPNVTTSYTLTATDAAGAQVNDTVTVTVESVSIAYFNADPTRIKQGETSTLNWNVLNADEVELNGVSVAAQGTMDVSPTQTTTYTLVARGGGVEVSSMATVEVYTVDILYFNAEPATIMRGAISTLSWRVEDAVSITIDQGIGSVDPESATDVTPNVTTTYTITATGGDGQVVTQQATVVVEDVDIVYFGAAPAAIDQGETSTLEWVVLNAEEVELDGVPVDSVDSLEVSPTETTTYTLVARGGGVEITSTTVVTVAGPEILFFNAAPMTIGPGETSTLSWKVENALTIEIDNGIGTVDPDGSVPVNPTETTTYTLTATGAGGAVVTQQVIVSVVYDVAVLFFHADPTEIIQGDTTTLSWGVVNATLITIEGGGDSWEFTDPAISSLVIAPDVTTTYTLTATRDVGGVVDTATAQLVITVVEPNRPPVAFAGLDVIASHTGTYDLDGTGSFDPDGDTLSYLWELVSNPYGAGTLTTPNAATTQIVCPNKGTYVVKMQVNDGRGGSDTDEVRVRLF